MQLDDWSDHDIEEDPRERNLPYRCAGLGDGVAPVMGIGEARRGRPELPRATHIARIMSLGCPRSDFKSNIGARVFHPAVLFVGQ